MDPSDPNSVAVPPRDAVTVYAGVEGALGEAPETQAQGLAARPDEASGAGQFTVVIPALNEEQAIAGTIRDLLEVRRTIIAETPVTRVNVVVVNDGSTDRTQEIASAFEEITTIMFERNRGYGAAIKAGFTCDNAELVGFMDADGTLQARSWIPLLKTLYEERADVVLGARLNPQSRMPAIRRLGNWLFARLLGFISGQPLTDCASGMRVIRRNSLRYLMPLPDGLHFTPAMSCNAVLDPRLTIREHPVPYAERVGRSKLNVLTDGARFLAIILLTGCFYHPLKCTAVGMVGSWIAATGLWAAGWDAVWLWTTVAVLNALAVITALISHQTVKTLIVAELRVSTSERRLQRCIRPRRLAGVGFLVLGIALAVTVWLLAIGAGQQPRLQRFALACWLGGAGLVLLGISLRMIHLIGQKFLALIRDPFARPPS